MTAQVSAERTLIALLEVRPCFDSAIVAVKWVRFESTFFLRSVIAWHLGIEALRH